MQADARPMTEYRSRTLAPEQRERQLAKLDELCASASKKAANEDFPPDAHLAYIFQLLKQLAEAESETDPAKGAESTAGKDHIAFSTLLAAVTWTTLSPAIDSPYT